MAEEALELAGRHATEIDPETGELRVLTFEEGIAAIDRILNGYYDEEREISHDYPKKI